jgi:sigma-B regulation protein RsbU (phosphoserine phosphatase)
VVLMREMSLHMDPQEMVRAYARRVREILPNDGIVSVSRRGLDAPWYKVSRASVWKYQPDPWKEAHLLPKYNHGLLGKLLYADKPVILHDLRLEPDDPAIELLDGATSIAAIPQYDGGLGLNMIFVLWKDRVPFDPERFPELVWQTNLFGRAVSNLVLSRQVNEAYDALDREMKVVADIQRSLLPVELPTCAGLDIATHYQASRNAGGDYYDFFALKDGKLGILIADVSGHGTPAAVLMAIMHAIAHLHAGSADSPRRWMEFVNRQLCERYTRVSGTFVTAFYAVFDPQTRELRYTSAGHNPPRVRLANPAGSLSPLQGRCVQEGPAVILPLDQAQGLPLGIDPDWAFSDVTITLSPGDLLVLYTDGITEAMNAEKHLLGADAMDNVLRREHSTTGEYLAAVLAAVQAHTGGIPMMDDSTLVVMRVEDGCRETGDTCPAACECPPEGNDCCQS